MNPNDEHSHHQHADDGAGSQEFEAGESHDHTDIDETSTHKLALVAGINFVGFVVELAGGLLFGSVALISDAFHMLFDMLAYVMAFSASYAAERFDRGDEWSYGLHRLEPVAAFLNGILLVPMVGYIVWEAYKRFLEPASINAELTLVIATGGLLVNIGSVFVLQGGEMSLNERGAFYHLLGDAGGSVAVIVSTLAVSVLDMPVADPLAAVLIGLLVLWSAGKVLVESTSIFLQHSPMSMATLRDEVTNIDAVASVEDIHVWQVCSQLTVATVQVQTTSNSADEQQQLRATVHETLADAGINHITVEIIGPSNVQSTEHRQHSH
ncbi:cation diffusion facilitator family transporter [Halovenus salina]|jgi:cobalt-zinc-cadmium efflux system protein|nr:cation diffusion facilitator family transporter [Halovenus salina]